jgi:hypothetical protein
MDLQAMDITLLDHTVTLSFKWGVLSGRENVNFVLSLIVSYTFSRPNPFKDYMRVNKTMCHRSNENFAMEEKQEIKTLIHCLVLFGF